MYSDNKARAIRAYMNDNGMDAVLLTSPRNVQWYSGLNAADSFVIIFRDKQYYITDFRFIDQIKNTIKGLEPLKSVAFERMGIISELTADHNAKSLGIEFKHVTLLQKQKYDEQLDLELMPVDDIVYKLRQIKTEEEIAGMRRGAEITEKAFLNAVSKMKPGVSEQDIYAEILYSIHKQGAEPSFPPVVAFGRNTGEPIWTPSSARLQEHDWAMIDMGVRLDSGCTDFTRTISVGGLEEKRELIYNIVRSANDAALEAIAPGVSAKAVDKAARDVIEAAGYGNCFEYATGHGVGYSVHELPRMLHSEIPLEIGNVVTIEPGIYIRGSFGARAEDMVVVTENGCESFYTLSKDLVII